MTTQKITHKYYCSNAATDACRVGFGSLSAYSKHKKSVHTAPKQLGSPCPPPPSTNTTTSTSGHPASTWAPFENRAQFELAEFLYKHNQMPGGNIDKLMQIWAALHPNEGSPFNSHDGLYEMIDSIKDGDVRWESFAMHHPDAGDLDVTPSDNLLSSWKRQTYEVWYRDPKKVLQAQLSNPNFKDGIDYAPKLVYNDKNERVWKDFMSGNWAWKQCNILSEDPECHGAMFIPIILGSDKTTVSVATGQHDYYPIYISNGNVHNHIRGQHNGAVSLLGFLPVPKGTREDQKSQAFRTFRRKLLHSAIAEIFKGLKSAMEKPEVIKCADGKYRRAIYGFGPYIADYPEQCIVACNVQGWCPICLAHRDNLDGEGKELLRSQKLNDWCRQGLSNSSAWEEWGMVNNVLPFTSAFPRADIHELIAPDLLHQVIKGTFKDHLVTWVEKYITKEHGPSYGKVMMDEIDRRIAAVPPFVGQRKFSKGRNFKQWTGNDTKALMKVFLPAIVGLVPAKMVKAISAFLDFCYIVRQPSLNEADLKALDDALERFCRHRDIFVTTGICPDGISLPRQHSLQHYHRHIVQFGAPEGLSTSITESKHIDAVKKPWRRTNHFEELKQMLLINQRMDKLAAFHARLFGEGTDESVEAVIILPERPGEHGSLLESITKIAKDLSIPMFPHLLKEFINNQEDEDTPTSDTRPFYGKVHVYSSGTCVYNAQHDSSGRIVRSTQQVIHCTRSWKKGPARHDCVFVNIDPEAPGFRGLYVGQVLLLFSLKSPRGSRDPNTPCALVQWFETVGNQPCGLTGMWMVKPEVDQRNKQRAMSVIHADSIIRPAHLIPIYGEHHVPHHLHAAHSLDAFKGYYVNKFSDYHAYRLAF
ncbi:hypothetical protein F5887DRAFT_1063026 [Amanita rubescens]|nr:hypothetical protein F5887DRAFT_1063026 [Amanita rubescens]